jgi:chromosome segregation ATPase
MVKHLQRRGIGLKDCHDIFDTPENNREEVMNLRVRNKDLSDSLVASRKETANWKHECDSRDEEIIRLKKINAKLESENKDLREKIDEYAQLLADALKDIKNEESAMEMLRMAFSELPAGMAFDVFGGVSKLLAFNINWHRIQPIIYREMKDRLMQLEKVAMSEKVSETHISNSNVTFPDAHFEGPMYDVNNNDQVVLGGKDDDEEE